MNMQDVPLEYFIKAGVRPVCGFVFRYDPADEEYGVAAVTDGDMPQMKNFEAACLVGKALQKVIFGVDAKPKTPTYYDDQGEPDYKTIY